MALIDANTGEPCTGATLELPEEKELRIRDIHIFPGEVQFYDAKGVEIVSVKETDHPGGGLEVWVKK